MVNEQFARHLFLSPHFDDAIGSCGGMIARLTALGHTVRVLTAFGGEVVAPLSVPASVLHAEWGLVNPVVERRLEDAAACRALGCDGAFLDFPDAIYRQGSDGRHLYPTFESLAGELAAEDRLVPRRLAAQVTSSLRDYPAAVYCPLAIGGHVDHVLVRECGRLLSTSGRLVAFYRDFYYDKPRAVVAVPPGMRCVTIALKCDETDKKLTAFLEYKSQIQDLFRTEDQLRAYFAQTGSVECLFVPTSDDLGRREVSGWTSNAG